MKNKDYDYLLQLINRGEAVECKFFEYNIESEASLQLAGSIRKYDDNIVLLDRTHTAIAASFHHCITLEAFNGKCKELGLSYQTPRPKMPFDFTVSIQAKDKDSIIESLKSILFDLTAQRGFNAFSANTTAMHRTSLTENVKWDKDAYNEQLECYLRDCE